MYKDGIYTTIDHVAAILYDLHDNAFGDANAVSIKVEEDTLVSSLRETLKGDKAVIQEVPAEGDGSCFFHALHHAARDIGCLPNLLNSFPFEDGQRCVVTNDSELEFVMCLRDWMANVILTNTGPGMSIVRSTFDTYWYLYVNSSAEKDKYGKDETDRQVDENSSSIRNAWKSSESSRIRVNTTNNKKIAFDDFVDKLLVQLPRTIEDKPNNNWAGEFENAMVTQYLEWNFERNNTPPMLTLRVVNKDSGRLEDFYQSHPHEMVLVRKGYGHYVSLAKNRRSRPDQDPPRAGGATRPRKPKPEPEPEPEPEPKPELKPKASRSRSVAS